MMDRVSLLIIRRLLFMAACLGIAFQPASAQDKIFLFGSSDLIRVIDKLEPTDRTRVSFGPHGAVGGFTLFCQADRVGLVLTNRQLTKTEIERCRGAEIVETVVTDPNLGRFFVYHDAKTIAAHPAIARAMKTIVDPPKALAKTEVTHQCNVPQLQRIFDLSRVPPPVPIFAWAKAERVEEAKMTVEPVIFRANFNQSECFLRVVAIDRDSIFAKHLQVGQIFYGLRLNPFASVPGGVETPGHTAIETPQQLRERIALVNQHGLNTIVWLAIYESRSGTSDDPRNFIRVSIYKSPAGYVGSEEPVQHKAGCIFNLIKECR